MFGYVRPCHPELKCRESDLYKATYCGLCGTLRKRYGLLAPMFLSYDLTFLALLLEEKEEQFTSCRGRCHANLLLKKEMASSSEALNLCADYTIILAWFQLKDRIADEKYWKKWGALILSFFLQPSYKKASRLHPQLDKTAEQSLGRLISLEEKSCDSIDEVADCFALILKDTVPPDLEKTDVIRFRCLEQILYHVGRWIYLIDARDDFSADKKSGSYNPLLFRYGQEGDDEALALTLDNSLSLARSSLSFLDFGIRSGTIENILSIGIPLAQKAVFSGVWNKREKIIRRK